jgi:hypothetical protein
MFVCEKCEFQCLKKGDWTRHLKTAKHSSPEFGCPCGKQYKTNAPYERHRTLCAQQTVVLQVLEENKELRLMLMEQQEQLKTQQNHLIELIPKVGHVTNKFNLNFFLNETCKEAMNWTEFVASLQVQEITGMAKMVCDGLQDLQVHQRPIHCVDAKRMRLCIKNEDKWELDNLKIGGTIRSTAAQLQAKWFRHLKEWEEEHPHWIENDAETRTYASLVSQFTSEFNEAEFTNYISRNITIPKTD